MPQQYLFINYRKKDAVILADSLNILLRDTFGDVVFLDSSNLEKGAVFTAVIDDALNKATCLLVLIGKEWLFQYDDRTGMRRLDLPDDWVRMEIERALARSIDVIPVLAPGVEMPLEEALPESIKPLLLRVPVRLRADSYVDDRTALIHELETNHGFKKQPHIRSVTADTTAKTSGKEGLGAIPGRESQVRQPSPDGSEQFRGPKAWMNGTTLSYYFFRDPAVNEANVDIVRRAIQEWQSLEIGLDFKEVTTLDNAQLRIGFNPGDGSWSYVGRDAENIPADQRTMNFGWDLTANGGLNTVLHEFGHVLGFSEEHRNPNAGIVWDEEKVYKTMAGPPNYWSREQTYRTIISKGEPGQYYGPWDPDSIMHFAFDKDLILEPSEYRNGLAPTPGLSDGDKQKARFLYPPKPLHPALVPLEAVPLTMQPGEQANFTVVPSQARLHHIQSFGPGEIVMMLFEDNNGQLATIAADDNTGQDRSAQISTELYVGRRYILRVRLFLPRGDTALMMW